MGRVPKALPMEASVVLTWVASADTDTDLRDYADLLELHVDGRRGIHQQTGRH